MPAPLLHSRVRDSIEIPQSPGEVLARIKALAGEQFRLEVDEADHDNIHFEMTRKNNDIIIHGVIRRWQGTESRLDFMGEVGVPASSSRSQQYLVAAIVAVAGIFMFKIAVLDSLRISPISRPGDLFAIIFAWLIPTLIVGLIAYAVIVRDRGSRKRWHLQQELAKIVEQIRKIETDAI